jgi:hypothetical protein
MYGEGITEERFMKRFQLLSLVVVLAIGPLLAHGEERIGILVDAECGPQIEGSPEQTAAHTVSCALSSREAGYGIISEGKFLRFDDYGNKQAILLLRATEKKSNLKVRVGGHFRNDLAIVSEIETVD